MRNLYLIVFAFVSIILMNTDLFKHDGKPEPMDSLFAAIIPDVPLKEQVRDYVVPNAYDVEPENQVCFFYCS